MKISPVHADRSHWHKVKHMPFHLMQGNVFLLLGCSNTSPGCPGTFGVSILRDNQKPAGCSPGFKLLYLKLCEQRG